MWRAAEKSNEISSKWTKDTLSKVSVLTKVKAEPADYTKAYSDFASAAAEMAAISIALSPVSGALAKSAQFGLRGGSAALKAVEAAKAAEGIASTGKAALSMVHPALEMTAGIAADASCPSAAMPATCRHTGPRASQYPSGRR